MIAPVTRTGLGTPHRLSKTAIGAGPVFSVDGQRIIAVEGRAPSTALVTWNVADQRELARLDFSVYAVSLSPHGILSEIIDSFSAPGCEHTLLYRTSDNHLLDEQSTDPPCSASFFSPDGTRVVKITTDGTISLIDAKDGLGVARSFWGYTQIAISPDGSLLAAGNENVQTSTDIWKVGNSTLLHTVASVLYPDSTIKIAHLHFSPDGAQVISAETQSPWGGIQTLLRVVSQPAAGGGDAREITSVDLKDGVALRWDDSQPAKRLAWIDDSGRLHLRADGNPRALRDDPGPYHALAFSPDGGLLAVAQRDGSVYLLRPADGGDVAKLDAGRAITQVVFSPDSSLLGTRSADGRTTIWRLADHTAFATLQTDPDIPGGHGEPSQTPSLIFSSDNQLLIAGGAAGVVISDLASGHELRRLEIAAEALAIGPEQHLLAILSQGQVTLWGVP
jgi:WD40 repeat protein